LDIHAGVKIANHDEPWRGGRFAEPHMSNNPAAAEMDVVGYPFGRGYGVLRGPLARQGADEGGRISAGLLPKQARPEILAMVKVEKLDALSCSSPAPRLNTGSAEGRHRAAWRGARQYFAAPAETQAR